MKKILAYVFLLLEMIGIVSIGFVYANKAAKLSAIDIHIPDGMHLTTNKDILITTQSDNITLPKDTVIIPEFVFPNNTVCFHYEGIAERLSASWDSFNEKDQLNALKIKAEQDLVDKTEKNKARTILLGFVVGIIWLVFGGVLSYFLLKYDKGFIVVIINIVAILIISVYLYSLKAYLWH